MSYVGTILSVALTLYGVVADHLSDLGKQAHEVYKSTARIGRRTTDTA